MEDDTLVSEIHPVMPRSPQHGATLHQVKQLKSLIYMFLSRFSGTLYLLPSPIAEYRAAEKDPEVILTIVLVCAVLASLAAGVLLAYVVCLSMFELFRIHSHRIHSDRVRAAGNTAPTLARVQES